MDFGFMTGPFSLLGSTFFSSGMTAACKNFTFFDNKWWISLSIYFKLRHVRGNGAIEIPVCDLNTERRDFCSRLLYNYFSSSFCFISRISFFNFLSFSLFKKSLRFSPRAPLFSFAEVPHLLAATASNLTIYLAGPGSSGVSTTFLLSYSLFNNFKFLPESFGFCTALPR